MRRSKKKHFSRTHVVTVRVTVNRPITRRQAQYTAWNHIDFTAIFGGGKEDANEPFDNGRITVRKS